MCVLLCKLVFEDKESIDKERERERGRERDRDKERIIGGDLILYYSCFLPSDPNMSPALAPCDIPAPPLTPILLIDLHACTLLCHISNVIIK